MRPPPSASPLDDVHLQALKRQQHAYWRKNLLITTSLLLCWFLMTYVSTYFARELNQYTLLGFPLGFYFTAQGNLLVYVLIVGIYARRMNRHDDLYRQELLRLQQQCRSPKQAVPASVSRL